MAQNVQQVTVRYARKIGMPNYGSLELGIEISGSVDAAANDVQAVQAACDALWVEARLAVLSQAKSLIQDGILPAPKARTP